MAPDPEGEAHFLASVRSAIQSIRRQEFEKVVVARRGQVALDERLSLPQILERLSQRASESTCFCLERSGKVFLGASPELLIEKQGRRARTEALAGSIGVSRPDFGEQLLLSEKDAREHQFVLREIVRRLEPLATSLSYPGAPELRRLQHIAHLFTPIALDLKSDCHILELVERLHPTPAVGGLPNERAVRWIVENERDERGFYAGPLGWLDEDGDGEFVVALRSALKEHKVAHLYAGSGIVEDSDPQRELEETELKLCRMLDALGAS